jgi:hypothetical protein
LLADKFPSGIDEQGLYDKILPVKDFCSELRHPELHSGGSMIEMCRIMANIRIFSWSWFLEHCSENGDLLALYWPLSEQEKLKAKLLLNYRKISIKQ